MAARSPSSERGGAAPQAGAAPDAIATRNAQTDPGAGVGAADPAGRNPRSAFLNEIKKSKAVFYNTVVAQAQSIEFGPERVTFTFSPAQRTLRDMLEQNRPWLEALARQFGGPSMALDSRQLDPPPAGSPEPAPPADRKAALREQALADAGVQALLDVFPAEIRDVEEI